MASSSWKAIPTHDFLVVHGYIRQCCHDLTLYIPNDIANHTVIWYYDVSTWKLEGDALTTFLFDLKNGESIYSSPFRIDNITFHCSLCPTGWKTNQKGFVQYYLEVKELPSNISSFTVYFEFYCYETKSSWKGLRTLTKLNDAVGWFHYTLPLKQCQDTVESLNIDHLTFGCSVELLNINYLIQSDGDTNEYKSDEIETMERTTCIQTKTLTLNQHIERTWMLHNYPLEKFKHCIYPKNFHSPSFENNYWCFECQGNYEHNIMIYCRLKLIRMPHNIKKMKIKCRLDTNMKCETDKKEDNEWETIDLSFKHNYTKWKAYLTDDRHSDYIRISVKIKILKLMNWNDVILDVSEWYKYGVLTGDYNPLTIVQYTDDIQGNGKDQMVTNLEYKNKQMVIKKQWIKPNFLNIPHL